MVELLEKEIGLNNTLTSEALFGGLKSEIRNFADQFQFRKALETEDLKLNELESAVDKCSKSLLSIGVDGGDTIGVYDAAIDEWLVLFSATQKLGVEMINIGREFSSEMAVEELNKKKCRVVFVSTNAQTFLKELIAKFKEGRVKGVFSEYAILLEDTDADSLGNLISRKAFDGLSKYCSDRELQKFTH
jgi:long-subunit acyl-CoA synthetase (AMP-forming)